MGMASKFGAGINPAENMARMYLISTQTEERAAPENNYYTAYWWIYLSAPFLSGILAGLANKVHRNVTDACAEGANGDADYYDSSPKADLLTS